MVGFFISDLESKIKVIFAAQIEKVSTMNKTITLMTAVLLLFLTTGFNPGDDSVGLKKFIGVWAYNAPSAPQGFQKGLIDLSQESKTLKGTVKIGSYSFNLKEIQTEKNTLTGVVIIEGERVMLDLNFEKSSFEGIAKSSQGNIPITGTRKSE